MKKIVAFIVMCFTCFTLVACGIMNSIKEYNGTKITKLTFTTVEYMGGKTVDHVIDFIENNYSSVGYFKFDEEEPELEVKKVFTDEEEKVFIDSCYSYGLFNLKDSYVNNNVDDGGGWNLTIDFEDGTNKVSTGSNASPTSVFNKCSTVFYDLCGVHILGKLPDNYIDPPNISYSFEFEESENLLVSTNALTRLNRGNYKWNKNESFDNDYYLINEEVKDKCDFKSNIRYQLVLYTANYRYKEKFKSLTVKEYDYNSELTNEKTIFESGWIKQIELDIQVNKIYIYELKYKNGDYVQYTFSTYCNIQ